LLNAMLDPARRKAAHYTNIPLIVQRKISRKSLLYLVRSISPVF